MIKAIVDEAEVMTDQRTGTKVQVFQSQPINTSRGGLTLKFSQVAPNIC